MIRTLNKAFLKEWTTAQLFNPAPHPPRLLTGCRRISTASTYALPRRHAFPSPLFTRVIALHYSTVPDPSTVNAKPDVLPPSTSTPRKSKVDLRPAPKKINQERSCDVKPPRSPSSTHRAQPLSPSSVVNTPLTAAQRSPGHSKAMQHDIAEATRHGILTPPPEGASRVARLWHHFVQLFKFYWSGLKMIFVTHRRQASDIRQRAAEAKANGQESELTRWETRFLRTYNRDLVKLVPFILTLIILEEALPLVVLYAPGLLPSTCLLPSQRERIETKRRAKQIVHLQSARVELLRSGEKSTLSMEDGVKSLNLQLARSISGAFSCSTWGPLFLQQRRIEKRLVYLSSDDALLVKEGFGTRLKEEELVEAIEERGLVPDSRTPQHLRDQLQWWLRGARDDKTRLALVLQAAVKETGGVEAST